MKYLSHGLNTLKPQNKRGYATELFIKHIHLMSLINQAENVPLVGVYSSWVQSVTCEASPYIHNCQLCKSFFHVIFIIREGGGLLMLNCLGISLFPLWENLGLPTSHSWDDHPFREVSHASLYGVLHSQRPPITGGRPQAAADPMSTLQFAARWSVYPQGDSAPDPSETQGRWGYTDDQGEVRGMEEKVSNKRGVSWEHKIIISLRGWQVASADISKKGDSEKRLMKRQHCLN